ncbi:MAG: SDR family oxidoreductase [Bifidobacteriaceae bacterium]|jgi:NAD(P)-dependent dehydrogenase (short-subunit alcohol dehydrogenase family)/triosephosphate isomerase|nr:SDR family oxidoreductase [Bifidobacteriaceae bacterium]
MTGRPTGAAARLIAISTKAYFGAARTRTWIRGVVGLAGAAAYRGVEMAILPSFPLLEVAADLLEGSGIALGAQCVAASADGAQTGEVTAALLAEIGCRYVEVGHAERRRHHGETPAIVRAKIAQALGQGLIPILCVGEDEPGPAERAARHVVASVLDALAGVDDAAVVVAYEPVWAIGADRGAPAAHIIEVADAVRSALASRPNPYRILYGGAAGPGTAAALGDAVDGLFLGRFAHNLDSLDAIVREVATAATGPRLARAAGLPTIKRRVPVNPSHPFPAERTAVVTGAGSARGIGRTIVSRLAQAGWHVAALDVDEAAVTAFAAEVDRDVSVAVKGYGVDIVSPEELDAAFTRIEAELPPVVGLSHGAGVASPVPFFDVTLDEWNRVLDINSTGTFLVNQRAIRGMVDRGVGRVVNLSSASAQMGGGTYSKVPYSAAKASVIGFSRAVAREVGKFGVTVNVVSPGPIDTEIMGGRLTDERKAQMASGLLVDRIGTPTDIAAAVEFLLSEDAGYITAAVYNVNGGLVVN